MRCLLLLTIVFVASFMIFVPTAYGAAWCGDGLCNGYEDISSCPEDCDLCILNNINCNNYCSDNTRYYNGYCSNGNCYYPSSEYCSYDCDPNQCISDPCAGVPPCNDYCEGKYAYVDGYCSGGSCTGYSSLYCQYGCTNGVCNGPPCSDQCSPQYATQCYNYVYVQQCLYQSNGCLDWETTQACDITCDNGACKIGPYRCISGGTYCTSSTPGACHKQNCGNLLVTQLDCAIDERCNYFTSCDYAQNAGKKACYDCITDSSCCYEGATGDATECDRCNGLYNKTFYSSSGHCCTKGWYWSSDRCREGEEACDRPGSGYSLFSTPIWHYFGYLAFYLSTGHFACCPNVFMYGQYQNYFLPITLI